MRLIKIEPISVSKGRYLLIFEDDNPFEVSEEILVRFGLYAGMELTGEDVENIKTQADKHRARSRAAVMIGRRQLSKKELTDRLVRKGESESDAEEAADWLEEIGAVDDENYAAAVARHYRAKCYGPMKIKEELYRRGIDRELRDSVLEQLGDMSGEIEQFAGKALKGSPPGKEELARVSNALKRRGFSWDDIKPVLDKFRSTMEDYD